MTRNDLFGRGRELRAIGILGGFQAGVMLANLVRVKIVALELGPVGLGLVSVIEQIVLVASLAFTLSLPIAAVKFLSFAHSRDPRAFARTYAALRRALTVLSLLGLAATLALALAAPGVFGSEVEASRDALIYAVAAIPLLNLLALLIRALAAAERPRAASAVTLGQWVAIAVCGGAGVVVAGLPGYFAGGAAGMLAVLAVGASYLRRRERTGDRGGRLRTIAELRGHPAVLRFALVHSVIMLTTPLAFLVARYVVLAEEGLAQVGLLAAAFGMSQALTMLLTPANQLFLTPALNRDEPPHLKLERTLRFRRAVLLAMGAVMLPLLLFPRTALEVLFAEEFTPVASYVFLFIAAEALAVISAVNRALLIGLDDFTVNVGFIVGGQAVLCVLVLLLVPAVGIAGVGVALIANHALVLALTSWRLSRRHAMATLHDLRPYVPAAVGMLALGAAVASLPEGEPALLVAKLAVLGAALTVGVVVQRSRTAAGRRA